MIMSFEMNVELENTLLKNFVVISYLQNNNCFKLSSLSAEQ